MNDTNKSSDGQDAEEKKKKSPGFWKESNRVTDSGVAALIGADAMTVLRCMRRHVWKDTKFGDPRLRKLYSLDEITGNRTLAMNRSIGDIARETGMDRRAVMKAIYKLLALELINESHPAQGNTPAIFAVGFREVTDREFYYAEAVADEAWEAIEAQAEVIGVKGGRNVEWDTRIRITTRTMADYASRYIEDPQETLARRTQAEALLDTKKKPRGNPKWERNEMEEPSPWAQSRANLLQPKNTPGTN